MMWLPLSVRKGVVGAAAEIRHRRRPPRDGAAWPASRSGRPRWGAARRPGAATSLLASTITIICRLAAATIFSRTRAPPRPLIRSSVPVCTSSAPSIVRSSEGWSASVPSSMPSARAWDGGALGGRDADDAQALAHALADARSTAILAVDPVPRPSTMPSSTAATATSADCRLSSSWFTPERSMMVSTTSWAGPSTSTTIGCSSGPGIFERFELAVDQARRHVVVQPRGLAVLDQRLVAAQEDELHVRPGCRSGCPDRPASAPSRPGRHVGRCCGWRRSRRRWRPARASDLHP